ncbi:MAG: hypothetical protein IPP06_05985 [Saprospiraceae bacterium]|nr:hypothetical protein [Candidatus Vicinibacter affinis]MBP6173969.1 hypothetical protein [Saprospiraceae bacterium]MBK7304517.1 hypothetical protein [Candidatus Vicinibacter affinis]MBK7800865.1 hypothetical protein [Candidatus Vicinibacter affinis]MBK8406163.1 hypothetical protein [Candidatus Vicinibacter affinis]
MKKISSASLFLLAVLTLHWACEKPDIPSNPFDDYKPTQDTVKFIFQDPDSASIAGLYTYIFKPTCANSGCHDGTFDPDFRTLESSYNTLVFRESIKKDGKYLYRVKPYSLDSSAILARLNGIVAPQMPIQIEPDSDWNKRKDHYISLVRRWIESGAPAIDGSIPKAGLPQIRLKGCLAMIGDTAFLERRPFSGPLLLDSLRDSLYLYFSFGHDAQNPLSFTNNKISLHPNPHVFDSTVVTLDLETGFPSFRMIGLYGDSVIYTHRVLINPNMLMSNHRELYFRTYLKDQLNPLSEIPAQKAIFSMKKYMSIERTD